jgi:hypothetical protein
MTAERRTGNVPLSGPTHRTHPSVSCLRVLRRAMPSPGRSASSSCTRRSFPARSPALRETADYLLAQLRRKRRAVLRWGPVRTQILSEVRAGRFLLMGFAGNSAPDHVDQLHSPPEVLKWNDAQGISGNRRRVAPGRCRAAPECTNDPGLSSGRIDFLDPFQYIY